MDDLPPHLEERLHSARRGAGRIVFMTGAGISAESGIPTFRGPEGYWTVGSRNYRPEELATYRAFSQLPDELWSWYLYRRACCHNAQPNPAHRALAALEDTLTSRFLLITQNVDGLHLRAGNSRERTFEIHGNIDFARCSAGCRGVRPLAAAAAEWPRERRLTPGEAADLHCDSCGAWLRPHVLWFDEFYDEEHFHYDSSQAAIDGADLLVVIGTSGATTLPMNVCQRAQHRGVPMVVVNCDPSPFSEMVAHSGGGYFAQGTAGQWVPAIAAHLGPRD